MSPFRSRAQLQLLRWKYNTCYLAYCASAEALIEASKEWRTPSPDMLQLEADSLRELTETRANLLEALRDGPDALT
jgi:hypothetical protein